MTSILPPSSIRGTINLPADKSIGHRTAILSALAIGTSEIKNYPASADPQSTLSCLEQLGISVEKDNGSVRIEGRGPAGFRAPANALDCGNSGTTMRLMAGILAGQPFDSILTGDESLRSRPMARIADPLRRMRAQIALTDGHAPIRITGGRDLKGITYRLPVASAQVKSCVLLGGLLADGQTTVIETTRSRDHTERMMGLEVNDVEGERHITVDAQTILPVRTWSVPADFSAAAFFLVAGAIVPNAVLELPGVGLNPTRNALLDVLREMGAEVSVSSEREVSGEPIGTLEVRNGQALEAVTVEDPIIPNLIDEIPILAVAATQAQGTTIIRDASELRIKETDRLHAMAVNLSKMGADIEETDDGLRISGPTPLQGTDVDAFDDHRIAMAMGIAGLVAEGETTIAGSEHARISFPTFWDVLREVSAAE